MILYAFAIGFFVGIVAILAVSWIADLRRTRRTKHVLGNIKEKLKYEGKINRVSIKSEKKFG